MMGPWAVSVGEQVLVYDISGNPLFRVANEQLARDAVCAVNSHDDLVAALKSAKSELGFLHVGSDRTLHVIDKIDAALAKAEGGK